MNRCFGNFLNQYIKHEITWHSSKYKRWKWNYIEWKRKEGPYIAYQIAFFQLYGFNKVWHEASSCMDVWCVYCFCQVGAKKLLQSFILAFNLFCWISYMSNPSLDGKRSTTKAAMKILFPQFLGCIFFSPVIMIQGHNINKMYIVQMYVQYTAPLSLMFWEKWMYH